MPGSERAGPRTHRGTTGGLRFGPAAPPPGRLRVRGSGFIWDRIETRHVQSLHTYPCLKTGGSVFSVSSVKPRTGNSSGRQSHSREACVLRVRLQVRKRDGGATSATRPVAEAPELRCGSAPRAGFPLTACICWLVSGYRQRGLVIVCTGRSPYRSMKWSDHQRVLLSVCKAMRFQVC